MPARDGAQVNFTIVDIDFAEVRGEPVDDSTVAKAVSEVLEEEMQKLIDIVSENEKGNETQGLPLSSRIRVARVEHEGDIIRSGIDGDRTALWNELGTGTHNIGVHASSRSKYRIFPSEKRALLIPLDTFKSGTMPEMTEAQRRSRVILIGGREFIFSAWADNPGQRAQTQLRRALNQRRGAIRERIRSKIARAVADKSAYRATELHAYIEVSVNE